MNSSISNSKAGSETQFIFKTVGICVGFALVYSLLIHVLPPDKKGLNQWQEVLIHAQGYVYGEKQVRCAIVGSSMGNRIDAEAVGPDDYNLSLAGGDAMTGLEIILRSGRFPTCILVETNSTLLRGKDQKLVDDLFHPIAFTFKKHFLILRDSFQPIGVLASLLKGPSAERNKPDITAVNFDELLKGQIEIESHLPEQASLDATLNELQHALAELKRHEVKIFLFDMPRPEVLLNGATNLLIQQQIKTSVNYPWLELPKNLNYQTEDTTHLTASSAKLFSQALKVSVDQALSR